MTEQELYDSLLPIYRTLLPIQRGAVYNIFAHRWNRLRDSPANNVGSAMQEALRSVGAIGCAMNGSEEYEEIIAAQEMLDVGTSS